jgi:succinate dehydrogenase/fumarate reductase flavoprotein subunit
MRGSRPAALLLVSAMAAGCASGAPPRSNALLQRADHLAREGAWEQAAVAYAQYVERFPGDDAAPRAAASRDTLSALLEARAELARLREQIARLREDLARRDSDLVRVRQEADRLRADLERLKELDLKLERRR